MDWLLDTFDVGIKLLGPFFLLTVFVILCIGYPIILLVLLGLVAIVLGLGLFARGSVAVIGWILERHAARRKEAKP